MRPEQMWRYGRRRSARLTLVVALAVALAGCGSTDTPAQSGITVIASTTILGDVAANIAGDDATVDVLLPLGADPHDYQVSARQIAAILSADLVVSTGLGLEEGLEDVLEQAAADGVEVLEIGPLLDPLPRATSSGDSSEGTLDPHVWLDPVRMADAATAIGETLETVAPGGQWGSRAAAYRAELLATDKSIAELLAGIPEQDRKLVTNHDSLGYFGARYGFEIIGSVIPGGSTLANPSSQDLADLVAAIEKSGVPAIFAETTEPLDLAEAVAAELTRPIVVETLYTGSLGEPGSPATTLIDMLLFNARTIATALQ